MSFKMLCNLPKCGVKVELKSSIYLVFFVLWISNVFADNTEAPVTMETKVSLEIVLKPLADIGPAPAERTRTSEPAPRDRTRPTSPSRMPPAKTVPPSAPPAGPKARKGVVDTFEELALTPYWDLDMAEGEMLTLDCGVYTRGRKDIVVEWWKDEGFLNTTSRQNDTR